MLIWNRQRNLASLSVIDDCSRDSQGILWRPITSARSRADQKPSTHSLRLPTALASRAISNKMSKNQYVNSTFCAEQFASLVPRFIAKCLRPGLFYLFFYESIYWLRVRWRGVGMDRGQLSGSYTRPPRSTQSNNSTRSSVCFYDLLAGLFK